MKRSFVIRAAAAAATIAAATAPGTSPLAQAATATALAPAGRTAAAIAPRRVETISGRVVDSASNQPLPNAQVVVVGTTLGTQTNAEGRFTLAGVPAGPQTVRVIRIGYRPQSRTVTVVDGQPLTLDFALAVQAVLLQEVVSIGYGTTSRGNVTGAIASVNMEDQPPAVVTPNVGQMIEGRVAGAQVTQNNGAPGGGLSIRIRGTNSIAANSEPLYVVDGIPAIVGTSSNDPYQNPLGALNPSDIESIEILKDASSTAIYGARGAAGVVLITTKRGRRGENQVTAEVAYGTQAAGNRLDMLNASQFAQLVNEARANAGQAAIYSQAQLDSLANGTRPSTDWQDAVLRTAMQRSYTLNTSGGDERSRFLISGSYFDQGGIVLGSNFNRYSGRINLERNVKSRLQVGTNLVLSATNNRIQSSDNTLGSSTVMGALWFNPASPVRNPDGTYVANSPVTWPITNPVANVLEQVQKRSLFNSIGNLFAEYSFTDALRLRSSLGLTANFERFRSFSPRTIPAGSGTNGSGSQFAGENFNLISENTLNYRRQIFGSGLDLLAGYTAQRARGENVSGNAQQFSNDLLGPYGLGTGTIQTTSTGYNDWALLSWLGRANYNLADRYLFTVTGRADGSSRFGENNKWGFFPSAAFAWRAIDEPFLADQTLFSDLKLRLSYGVTGNQEIGLYNSLARLSTNNYAFGGATVIGYATANTAPNPDLKWETTRQYNAGLDLGWAANRFTASLDAYSSLTEDLLLSVSLPATSGYQNQLRNVGSVRNRGLELALGALAIAKEHFSWRTSLSAAANRNEIVDLGAASSIPYTDDKGISGQTGSAVMILQEGQPLGTFIGLRTNGIYQEGDACPLKTRRATLDCVPGEYRYVDTNGDSVINSNDRVILGNGQADWYGGLTNEFTLGPVNLNIFFQGSFGNEVLNGPAINIRNVNTLSNQTTDALRRWTPTNRNTDVPRANANRPRELYDIHVEDASFIRLQSLTVGYRLPSRLLRGGLSNARVYLSGQNLHVWTTYSGFDPEVNSFGGDARARGIDLGGYPRARVWNLGTNLTF